MEMYNSGGYGAYHISKFMIEFNHAIVLRGDFHRYILCDVADSILNPQKTGEDPIHYFSDTDVIDEYPKSRDNILKSMYTVFHETTHLVQDFTLGSEMLRDSLYDIISGVSLEFLKALEVHEMESPFPLMQSESYRRNEKISALWKLYDTIFKNHIYINLFDKKIRIGTTDLVEAYAAAKTFYYMIRAEPDSVRDDELNLWFHNSKLASIYRKAWSIYERTLAFEKESYKGGTLTSNQILDMTAFLIICDISLHIPVPMFDECLQKDYELPEYYLPYVRFIRIEQTLIQNNGFPDAVEGEDFYITFFDFVAKCNGWPTFQETYESWCDFFADRMYHGFMISDGYRMICAGYKRNYANELIVAPPGSFFMRTGIPALVRYYKGKDSFFEYVQMFDLYQMIVMDNHPISPFKDPYVIMTSTVFYNHWSADDFFKGIEEDGALWSVQVGPIFLREIFCRIFAKEFYRAVLEKSCLSCPLVNLSCLAKTDACCCLKTLTRLPDHCCLDVWLRESNIQSFHFYWR